MSTSPAPERQRAPTPVREATCSCGAWELDAGQIPPAPRSLQPEEQPARGCVTTAPHFQGMNADLGSCLFGAVPARHSGSPGICTLGCQCCGKASKLPGAEAVGADGIGVVTWSCAPRPRTGWGWGGCSWPGSHRGLGETRRQELSSRPAHSSFQIYRSGALRPGLSERRVIVDAGWSRNRRAIRCEEALPGADHGRLRTYPAAG